MRLQFLAISCALFATLLLHLTIMPPVPAANELENATMKPWIADTSGIKEETELEDANVHVQAEGAKWWIKLRRKIITRLQLTNNLWDWLVDHANASGDGSFDESNRIVLKSYRGLGEKTGGARQANLRKADIRQRSLNIIEAYLPECDWLTDLHDLTADQPVLTWFNELDNVYLKSNRSALLAAQTAFTSFRWTTNMPLTVFIKEFARRLREHEFYDNFKYDEPNYWDQFQIALMCTDKAAGAADGYRYFERQFDDFEARLVSIGGKDKLTFALIKKWQFQLIEKERQLRASEVLPVEDYVVSATNYFDNAVPFTGVANVPSHYFRESQLPHQPKLENKTRESRDKKVRFDRSDPSPAPSQSPAPSNTPTLSTERPGFKYDVPTADYKRFDET